MKAPVGLLSHKAVLRKQVAQNNIKFYIINGSMTDSRIAPTITDIRTIISGSIVLRN